MRLRSETGQVLPLVGVVLMTLMLGVGALVLDVGARFVASRHVQGVADAAALAAARDLPQDPGAAVADANAYARTNGGTLDSATVQSGDTISVQASQQAPLFFARAFGISDGTVRASAVASVSGASELPRGGPGSDGTGRPIPFAVDSGDVAPFGQETTLDFGPSDPVGSGQFGLIDFSGSGNASPPTLASWIADGFPGTLGTGTYPGVTGNKVMPGPVRDALAAVAAQHAIIALAVYSGTNGEPGANMTYTVDGWAAFELEKFDPGGNQSTLTGKFVQLDFPAVTTGGTYYGLGKVQLTK